MTSLFPILALSTPAHAEDSISVNINGRTYTCGEGGAGGNFRFFCKCRFDFKWNDGRYEIHLDYNKTNRNSGNEQNVKELQTTAFALNVANS